MNTGEKQKLIINEENYVTLAEEATKKLKAEKNLVTTSKIRNLLAMVSDIYNDVLNVKDEKLTSDVIERINYMKLRFYYEAGRDLDVKRLLETARVFNVIDGIGGSRKNYILFSRYIEALVAFHRYYGGKD